jgi:hypothetical protein
MLEQSPVLRGRKIRSLAFAFDCKIRSEIWTPPASPASINPETPTHAARSGLNSENPRTATIVSTKANLPIAPDNHLRRSAVKFETLNVIKAHLFLSLCHQE